MVFRRFCCLRLGFGLVHCSIRVVGRRVDRIQFQFYRLRCIDHVMVCLRRDHNRVPVARVVFFFVKDEPGLALLDPEELINIRMHLVPDLFARMQAHHHKLGVFTGEQYLTEVGIL